MSGAPDPKPARRIKIVAPPRPRPRVNQVSPKRRAYNASPEHMAAYMPLEEVCVGHALGAPGRCFGPLTRHHTMKCSVAGRAYAEAHAPVVALCSSLNDAIESDSNVRAWALAMTFERNGKSFPFLVLAKGGSR